MIWAFTGTQGFLRKRFLKKVLDKHTDWRVEYGDLEEAVASQGMLGDQVVVVLPELKERDLPVLKGLRASKEVSVVINQEEKPKAKKAVAFLESLKGNWQDLNISLKSWEAEKESFAFVDSEIRRLGFQVGNPKISEALVARCGQDLGVLSYEVEKATLLASAEGSKVVTPDIVSRSHAGLVEASVEPLIEALGTKQSRMVAHHLSRIRSTSKADPTMKVCAWLAKPVAKWLRAAELGPDGADEMGTNEWYYKNKVYPYGSRWGVQGSVGLLGVIATTERALKDGHINAWVELEAGLLRLCLDSSNQ